MSTTSPRPTGYRGTDIHPKHSYAPTLRNGLEAPEPRLEWDDSPTGPDEDFHIYRTRGPECDEPLGLPPLRGEWICGRGDVEPHAGRGSGLAGKAAEFREQGSQIYRREDA